MRLVFLTLAALSLLAGVGLSLAPIGACNHSLWQWGCVMVLMPSIKIASCFLDVGTWEFQRMMFVPGIVQAGAIIGVYYLAARIMK